MNGIHDLGGMTGFGPVCPEPDEPVFHADWERRVFAMNIAGLAFLGPVDRARHAIERIAPARYLTTSYYEHWLDAVETMVRDLGHATDAELASGRAVTSPTLPHPAPDAAAVEGLVRGGMSSIRSTGRQQPRFSVGDRVRARNLEVPGHTRLAGYVRGRLGTVVLLHGTHAFPDTAAHDRGEDPQPLYTVRFEARELWGENVTRRDCVYFDLWEDHLAPEGAK
jgi:nitrile hydratase subunit beta